MRAIIRYFFHRRLQDDLPHLRRGFLSPADGDGYDPEIELVLMAGVAPDASAARELFRKYDVFTAAELLVKLPKRRLNLGRRLQSLLRKIEGAYSADPHLSEHQQIRHGIYDHE